MTAAKDKRIRPMNPRFTDEEWARVCAFVEARGMKKGRFVELAISEKIRRGKA